MESFLEYIAEHKEDVFGTSQPKWLKGHLLYVEKDWKNTFHELEPIRYGEIMKIVFPSKEGVVNFYAYQWAPGLLMMFTSSTEDQYEKTLRQFIIGRKGISPAWIKPSVLDQMKNFLVDKYNARIYRFISRRYPHWKVPAQIRPGEARRISYSGNDAGEALKEIQALYGVIPSSMDMEIGDSKMQLNREGLFIVRRANLETMGILREVVDKIIAEQVIIRDTSEKFNVETKTVSIGNKQFNIPQMVAGKIILPNTKLSELMVKKMFRHTDDELYLNDSDYEESDIEMDFSFIDTYVQEDPMIFRATVVDEEKGTVFGLSGVENEIALIPKHRTTFESFIKFYSAVVENFDDSAKLATFSESVIA